MKFRPKIEKIINTISWILMMKITIPFLCLVNTSRLNKRAVHYFVTKKKGGYSVFVTLVVANIILAHMRCREGNNILCGCGFSVVFHTLVKPQLVE